MENKKIDNAISYYKEQEKEIVDFINKNNNLNNYTLINKGRELLDISSKISGLEIARNN